MLKYLLIENIAIIKIKTNLYQQNIKTLKILDINRVSLNNHNQIQHQSKKSLLYLKRWNSNENDDKILSRSINNGSNSIEKLIKPFINEKSIKTANSKHIGDISVHERLHQQALSNQKITKRETFNHSFCIDENQINDLHSVCYNKKKKKNKSVKSNWINMSNWVDRLYNQGLKKMYEVERKHK